MIVYKVVREFNGKMWSFYNHGEMTCEYKLGEKTEAVGNSYLFSFLTREEAEEEMGNYDSIILKCEAEDDSILALDKTKLDINEVKTKLAVSSIYASTESKIECWENFNHLVLKNYGIQKPRKILSDTNIGCGPSSFVISKSLTPIEIVR